MKTPDPKENYPEYLYQAALLAGVPLRDIDDLTAEDIVRAVNARQEQLNPHNTRPSPLVRVYATVSAMSREREQLPPSVLCTGL